jgi:hypothetical protein
MNSMNLVIHGDSEARGVFSSEDVVESLRNCIARDLIKSKERPPWPNSQVPETQGCFVAPSPNRNPDNQPSGQIVRGNYVHSGCSFCVCRTSSQRPIPHPFGAYNLRRQRAVARTDLYSISKCPRSPRSFKSHVVTIGQRLVIQNPENWTERDGRVTRLGRCYAGRTEVGIEFSEPTPDFWLIRTDSKHAD